MPAPKRSGATEIRCEREVRLDRGHLAGDLDERRPRAPAPRRSAGRRRSSASRSGSSRPDERQDLACSQSDGVGVRLVQEVADEEQAVAAAGLGALVGHVVDVRDDVDVARRGARRGARRASALGHDEHRVGRPVRRRARARFVSAARAAAVGRPSARRRAARARSARRPSRRRRGRAARARAAQVRTGDARSWKARIAAS